MSRPPYCVTVQLLWIKNWYFSLQFTVQFTLHTGKICTHISYLSGKSDTGKCHNGKLSRALKRKTSFRNTLPVPFFPPIKAVVGQSQGERRNRHKIKILYSSLLCTRKARGKSQHSIHYREQHIKVAKKGNQASPQTLQWTYVMGQIRPILVEKTLLVGCAYRNPRGAASCITVAAESFIHAWL